MATIDLKSLVSRLNEPCRRALEAAAGLTLSRTHYNVEIEHWLIKLLDISDGDLPLLIRHYDVDEARLRTDLNRAMDRMRTGNARAPSLSPDLVECAKQAWLFASLEHGAAQLRSGHLLWALLADEALARRAREASGQLLRLSADLIKRDFAAITANSGEAAGGTSASRSDARAGSAGGPRRRRLSRPGAVHDRSDGARPRREDRSGARPRRRDPPGHRHPDAAAAEQPDPDRRGRRRQDRRRRGVRACASPAGDVPPALRDVSVRTLDLGLLQAGAGVKGEFENRLKSVIEEVKASPVADHPVHRRGAHADRRRRRGRPGRRREPAEAGAGARRAAHDRRDDLGGVQEIFREGRGADPPLPGGAGSRSRARRPRSRCCAGWSRCSKKHHGVRILDEAVSEAVRLSARYIPSRQLPDKSVVADRYGVRAGRDEPGGGSAGHRGPRAAHRR